MPERAALTRLEEDGLVRRAPGSTGTVLRTTKRWQGAMARAALFLYRDRLEAAPAPIAAAAAAGDLRVPVTLALVDVYGTNVPDDELARLVEAVLPIEASELSSRDFVRAPEGL